MQLPQFQSDIEAANDTVPFDEVTAQRRAMELTEAALGDPVEGSAVLRAAAMLMAYLASHQPEPERALSVLITEQSGNAHTVLHRFNQIPTGTA